jgi:hypothetical protein
MRETITFPRPYHRSLTSTVLIALLGAALLVLGRPGPIAEQSRIGHRPSGGVAVVQGPTR